MNSVVRQRLGVAIWLLGCSVSGAVLSAQGVSRDAEQSVSSQTQEPDHAQMQMGSGGWQLMQDGVLFAEFNHQSGPRGGNEFVAPNWWMGMASRETPRGRVTFSGMLSLDPATVGKGGYREIFQAGEALNGRPLIEG